MANIDLQNRAPSVTRTPDFRNRVERRYDVLNWVPKTPADILAECWKPLGTLDEEYTDCYLIDQRVEGQNGDFYEPCKFPPVLLRVFEQLNGTAETQIGDPGVVMDQYGNQSVIIDYWQINLGTSTYQVPGVTAAPAPFTDCILKTEERTNDGTLRKIRRTYINSGLLSDTETLRFGGKLVIREITAIGLTPPTPSGWTLVTTSTEFVSGREVVRVGFASASGGGGGAGTGGVISTDVQYNISPDQGATGVTVTTIRYVTGEDVVVNPITGPVGSELIRTGVEEDSGYKIWTSVFASGQGTITTDVDIREGGKLILYSITSINSAPATPSPTIGGTVTLISTNVRNGTDAADGTVIYDYKWAEGEGTVDTAIESQNNGLLLLQTIRALGSAPATPSGYVLVDTDVQEGNGYQIFVYKYAKGVGEISRAIDYSQSSDQGTTGVTRTTIRYLVAPAATVQPTSLSGSVEIGRTLVEEAGYRMWTTVWAKGAGTVVSDVETKDGGKLILYRIIALGSAPSAPSPTIGGTVTLISTDVRQSDGYTIYDYQWTEGIGEIGRNVVYQQSEDQGTLGVTFTTIRYLVATGATVQPTSLAGSINIGNDYTDGDGYRIWTTRWAKGTGKVSEAVHTRQDGLREVTYISLGTRVAPSVGVVIRDDYRLDEGFSVYTVTSIQSATGGAVTGATLSFERYVPFLYPGRAKAYHLTASNGWEAYDVFRSPPVRTDVKATITVTYQTSNSLGTISDYWNPSEWATIQAEWIGLDNLPGFNVVSLPGYRSVDDTPLTFTASVWEDGVAGTMLGNIVYGGTTAIVTVTGGPADPGGNTYTLDATIEPAFTATDGTIYYRKTIVSAAIPAQSALPV